MKYCIVIGAYALPQFVELCGLRCERLFGDDVPILVSDDHSNESKAIEQVADKRGWAYICGRKRRSHFSGDIQAFINGLKFSEQTESDAVIKLSQRFIPVLPGFKEAADQAFADDRTLVILPGQISKNQIARPAAGFYSRFGILTDVLAVRRGAITPEEFMEVYRRRVLEEKNRWDSFAETTWGWLIDTKFEKSNKRIPEWTNYVPFTPKLFLRKSQSTPAEYAAVAAMEGLTGEWDVREWIQIERERYKARPDRV